MELENINAGMSTEQMKLAARAIRIALSPALVTPGLSGDEAYADKLLRTPSGQLSATQLSWLAKKVIEWAEGERQ